MIDMAGKRLAAAGVLAAAVAATAALWVAQHTPLPAQLRTIRQPQATITAVNLAYARVPLAQPASQLLAQPPFGLIVTAGVLLGLVLFGVVPRQHRTAVPVTARPPRRSRAPPSPGHRTARTRGH
jgi:hypothetical protein